MKRVMHVKDYLYGRDMAVESLKLEDILLFIIRTSAYILYNRL